MGKKTNKQLICFTAWILSAAFILFFNTFKIFTMLNKNYEINQDEITEAEQKSIQLTELIDRNIQAKKKFHANFKKIKHTYSKKTKALLKKSNHNHDICQPDKIMRIKPPHLSGIIFVTNMLGRLKASAIIDNKKYSEKEQVNDFRINKITSKGVLFTKNKKQWFVLSPDNYYSKNN